MLTVQQMSTITKELILGMEPTLTTQKANEFREEVAMELVDMQKNSIVPDLSYDFD